MVKFILEKIQLRNVRCYGDDMMEMDFPLNNLTVFTGRVGAGKSTIVKSVSMALYGEDGGVKGEKLTIDDMVNEKTGKNLEIHLYFKSIDDNKNDETHNYEIHLYHKHSSYGNKLVFIKDGVDISANGKLDTYRLIEKTLIPKQVYHNIYYFTQQAKNFFTALPNSEQKEIFNSILDLSEYDNYYQNAKEKCDELKLTLKDIKNKEIVLVNDINTTNNYIDSITKKLDDEKEKDENRISEIEKSKSIKMVELNNLKYKLAQMDNIDDIKKKKDDIVENFYSVKQKLEILIADNTKQKMDLADNYKKQFEIEKNKFQSQFLSDSADITKLINEKTNTKNNLQKEFLNTKIELESNRISEENKEKDLFDKQCQELNNELNDISFRIESLSNDKNKEIDEIEKQHSVSSSDILKVLNSKEMDRLKCKNSIDQLKIKIKESEEKLSEYENDLTNSNAVCRTCGQPLKNKDHIQKHISEIGDKISGYKNELSEYESKLNELQLEIKEISNDKENEFENYNNKKTEINNSYLTKLSNIENERNEIKKKLFDKKQKFENDVILLIRNNYKSKIENLENQLNINIENLDSEIKENNNKIDVLKNEMMNDLLNLKNKFQEDFKNKTSELDINISKYKEQLKYVIDKYNEDVKNIDDSINSFEILQKEINNIITSVSNDDILINDIRSKVYDDSAIIEFSKKRDDLQNKLMDNKKLEKSCEEDIEIGEFWKQAFSDSGIKSMLIDSAIPHMNECVREELDRVAPGVFTVSFDTLSETKSGNIRDKFSINIVNNVKGSTGHKKLSGGEKRIVDLCCMTALRSLAEKLYNKKFCHIFYDEILDSLDSECKEQFCRNAKYQSENGLNITLITHDLPEDVDPDRIFPF